MRKVLLTMLLVTVVACAIAVPVVLAAPESSCATLSEGLYVGLSATFALVFSFLALIVVRCGTVIATRATCDAMGVRLARTAMSWIPPPVLLAAAALDDPQIFDGGVSWSRAFA